MTHCVPTAWLATSSVWFRSSSASVLCQPVWPPVEHTCVKKHRYILALQTFRRKWGRKGGLLYFQIQPNMISSVKSVGTLTLMKTILSFLQYSASHETSAQVIWMEGRDKKQIGVFHRPALGWRPARRGWGHHWHRQELLAPRKICRKDPGRQAGKENIFASIFCLMSSTDTSWQNRIQNGYIYLPIPSELVNDHSLVVDSNWQFSAHNPTCAWSCGQNYSTLVHKVD